MKWKENAGKKFRQRVAKNVKTGRPAPKFKRDLTFSQQSTPKICKLILIASKV
jgi:hypothetical protein